MNKDNNTIFEWDAHKVEALIFGFVRDNIDNTIPDISSIIRYYLKDNFFDCHIYNQQCSSIKYMSDNSITCNFNSKTKYKYYWSTIIFTPYISELFKLNNTTNLNNYTNRMIVKCDDYESGLLVQCGILSIPKNKKIELKTLKNDYFKLKNPAKTFALHRIYDEVEPMLEIAPWNKYKRYYFYGNENFGYYGIDKTWNYQQLFPTNKNQELTVVNILELEVCIRCIKNYSKSYEYYLYFKKNKDTLGNHKTIQYNQKLDFDNNDYLFVLSSTPNYSFDVLFDSDHKL